MTYMKTCIQSTRKVEVDTKKGKALLLLMTIQKRNRIKIKQFQVSFNMISAD